MFQIIDMGQGFNPKWQSVVSCWNYHFQLFLMILEMMLKMEMMFQMPRQIFEEIMALFQNNLGNFK